MDGRVPVIVIFHGVRGSTPAQTSGNEAYGGNTSCVALDIEGAPPIVLDLGTGLRSFGATVPKDEPFEGVVLLSHLHWDHVQGLPFFGPALRAGSSLEIYGPSPDDCSLGEAFDRLIRPPYFPITLGDFEGNFAFHHVESGELHFGSAVVKVAEVPHLGPTNGYRVEAHGVVVVYLSDHQGPIDGPPTISAEVRELCQDADLLIHDAQYTDEEFADRAHWGHCTFDYAVHVASECRVRRLALYHHDPAHDDATLDRLLAAAIDRAALVEWPIEVLAAAEGMHLILTRAAE